MAVANTVRAVALGALAATVLAGTASLVVLYAVAFAVGVAETVYDSAARAMLPQVVRRDQLDRGNGLLTTAEEASQGFLGAPLGSVLFALAVAAPLLATAGGFALAAVLVLTIAGDAPARPWGRAAHHDPPGRRRGRRLAVAAPVPARADPGVGEHVAGAVDDHRRAGALRPRRPGRRRGRLRPAAHRGGGRRRPRWTGRRAAGRRIGRTPRWSPARSSARSRSARSGSPRTRGRRGAVRAARRPACCSGTC